MATGQVVTHMIFHAITANQNARIRGLHRKPRVSRKSRHFFPLEANDRQKQSKKMIGSPLTNHNILLNPIQ